MLRSKYSGWQRVLSSASAELGGRTATASSPLSTVISSIITTGIIAPVHFSKLWTSISFQKALEAASLLIFRVFYTLSECSQHFETYG